MAVGGCQEIEEVERTAVLTMISHLATCREDPELMVDYIDSILDMKVDAVGNTDNTAERSV